MLRATFNYLSYLAGTLITRARRDEGQTMAEYGVLIVTIAVVVVVVAVLLGSSISKLFSSVASHT